MTRRRSGVRSTLPPPRRPVASPLPKQSSIGVWYAVLIGAVLLIATGLYAASLHREIDEWQDAARQLSIGQELLRQDRDEILEKARERESMLATLEAGREQDKIRLDGIEDQRQKLQANVLRLTQALAQSEHQVAGADADADQVQDIERWERERERMDRDLAARESETERLRRTITELTETLDRSETELEMLRAEKDGFEDARVALERETVRVRERLAERREDERTRQIIRAHLASLGETKPYIAELESGDWSVIESWLSQQLARPMAIPDLSSHGLSFEGARLVGDADGPPMAMLLYANPQQRPVSLTIALDRQGEKPLVIGEQEGLKVVDWREERHAFVLAGGVETSMLEAVGVELLNDPPRMSGDASVPLSRYIRPSQRPANGP
ncbi:MAG: hypothetical protein AAGA73_11495 [Pseudomonadota bacterium]